MGGLEKVINHGQPHWQGVNHHGRAAWLQTPCLAGSQLSNETNSSLSHFLAPCPPSTLSLFLPPVLLSFPFSNNPMQFYPGEREKRARGRGEGEREKNRKKITWIWFSRAAWCGKRLAENFLKLSQLLMYGEVAFTLFQGSAFPRIWRDVRKFMRVVRKVSLDLQQKQLCTFSFCRAIFF